MTDLKAAARAGDIQAIAQLMNASFGPKGISVKIAKSGAVLKVLLESDRLPDRKLAGAVRKGLDGISPQGIEKVFLKAQSNGGEDSWTEQWATDNQQPIFDDQTEAETVPTEASSRKKGNSVFDYVLASIGGLLGGPIGIVASPLVLYFLGKVSRGSSKWSLWFFIGIFGAPLCVRTAITFIPGSFWESELARYEFEEGVENATNAANLVQAAETPPDWEEVADLWTAAIENMEAVPESSADKEIAQQKAAEYEKNLEYAQQVAQGFIDRGQKLFQELNGDYFVMGGLTDSADAVLLITQSQWNDLTPEQRTDLESYARGRIKDINTNPDKYLLRDIPRSSPVFDQMLEKYQNTCASCWSIMVSYSDTKPYGLDETVVRGSSFR